MAKEKRQLLRSQSRPLMNRVGVAATPRPSPLANNPAKDLEEWIELELKIAAAKAPAKE